MIRDVSSHVDVVLQDIKFPMSLDVYDLCTPELQQRLVPARDKFKAEEDKRVELAQMVHCDVLLHRTLMLTALSEHDSGQGCLLFYIQL